jgi:ABC-type tungstate transport system substrate-binding protein
MGEITLSIALSIILIAVVFTLNAIVNILRRGD